MRVTIIVKRGQRTPSLTFLERYLRLLTRQKTSYRQEGVPEWYADAPEEVFGPSGAQIGARKVSDGVLKHTEDYDERKLYASVYAACLSVRTPAGEAELTAQHVCTDVSPWLAAKHEVTSADIRRQAAGHLAIYNPHAAYLYRHHGVIS